MRSKTIARATATLLAGGIAAGSILRVSHVARSVHVRGPVHYTLHILVFVLLAALLARSTTATRTRALLCVCVVLFGFATEYYEHIRDGYPIESADVVADTLGAVLGMLTSLPWRSAASEGELLRP